ncbi:MAG: cysteine--tRNA ligase [Actinomycetota bacterium]
MALRFTNTLTGSKDAFVPREEGRASIYVCGPTVYDDAHVGHARVAVVFDVLRRFLAWRGFTVTLVQNITDIDDKIIAKAAAEGVSVAEIAERYSWAYDEAMAALGVQRPSIVPRATAHVPEMLALVGALVDAGYAYAAGGNVFFSVASFKGYGKLSKRSLDEMRAGERVEVDPHKRDPMDFVLWKGAKPGEPAWDSPWGPGRPGWHIECSAMARKYLGEGFDIHGGGQDLIFPHHENEIAQAEAASGTPFARYWLHNGMVRVTGEKMSKSLSNFTVIRELLASYPAPVVRFFLTSAQYRSPIDFSAEAIEESRAAFGRLAGFARNAAEALAGSEIEAVPATGARERFVEAMNDDLNTPAAVAALFDLVGEGNVALAAFEAGETEAGPKVAGAMETLRELLGVLGLDLDQAGGGSTNDSLLGPLAELVLELRDRARAAKDFATSDMIRDRLAKVGIRVEDRSGGSRWHLER